MTPLAQLALPTETQRAVAGCAAPPSEIVFTYLDEHELDPDRGSDDVQRVRASVATVGEPWVSGFDPSRLAADPPLLDSRSEGAR